MHKIVFKETNQIKGYTEHSISLNCLTGFELNWIGFEFNWTALESCWCTCKCLWWSHTVLPATTVSLTTTVCCVILLRLHHFIWLVCSKNSVQVTEMWRFLCAIHLLCRNRFATNTAGTRTGLLVWRLVFKLIKSNVLSTQSSESLTCATGWSCDMYP